MPLPRLSCIASAWQIETAFQELTVDLACVVQTWGYPKAALFAFAVAVVCYNAFSVSKGVLCTQSLAASASKVDHPQKTDPTRRKPKKPAQRIDELLTYYLADEIAGMWRGMMVVLPERFWEESFASLTPGELRGR